MKKIFARRKEGEPWSKAFFCFMFDRIAKGWVFAVSFCPTDSTLFKTEIVYYPKNK
jgi:hypothetical protein